MTALVAPARSQSVVSWSATAPATSGTTGGTGTWNTTGQNWWTGSAAAAWNNAANDTAVFAGTSGTVTVGENLTAGGLSFNTPGYRINLGGNTLTLGRATNVLSLTNVTNGTISGLVTGTGNVRLDGGRFSGMLAAGTLNFTGSAANGWSGTTTITNAQTLAISATSQALVDTAAINLTNGGITLSIDNNATAIGLDRINDAATITVTNGGLVSWSNGGATSTNVFAETTGTFALTSGELTINQLTNKTNGSQTLTLSGLNRIGDTTSVRFAATGAIPDAVRNRILVTGATATPANQIIGPWATAGTDYAVYDASGYVLPAGIAASNEADWTTSSDAYTTGTAQTLTATRTITALRLTSTTAGVTVGTGANLETFGILAGAGGTTSNINFSATGSGVITTPNGGGQLLIATNFTPAGNGHNRLRVAAPIADNGSPVTLVKTGPGSLELSAANTFSGGLVINGGRVFPTSAAALGTGGITFAGNGLLDVSQGVNSGQTITLGEGLIPTFYQNGGTIAAPVVGGGGFAISAPSNNPTLTLSSTANTFTGPVYLNRGYLRFASLADAEGVGPVVIGQNNNFLVRFVWLGGAKTFEHREFVAYNGTGGGARISNEGTGPLTVVRDLGQEGSGVSRVLNLAGSATGFSNEFRGRIADASAGTVGVLKEEAGTWILSATNTYTGTTTLTGGDLAIASDANISGTASPLLFNGGTLKILGASLASLDPNRPTFFTGTSGLGTAAVGFNIDEPGHAFTVAQDLNMTSGGLTKTGRGTLVLTGTSTYAGTTTIANGLLRFGTADSLTSGTARTVLVQPAGAVTFDFGLDQTTLARVTGTSPGSVAITGTSAAALDFSAAGASLTAASLGGVGDTAFTGTLTPNGTAYRLGGGGGTLDFQSLLTGGNTLTVGGNIAGLGGTVRLSNSANDYTGKTSVAKGTLEIVSLGNADGTASSLGAPTTPANGTIDLGSGTSGATLRYLGSGDTSDRVLNLAGTTGGAMLDASGSGALVLTAANTATGAGSKTFTLTGTSTAANEIGSIAGSDVSVDKAGPGRWRLTAASSFGGQFTLREGTIVAAADAPQDNPGVFGTNSSPTPVIGDSSAGASGQAALFAESGRTLARGLEIAALAGAATQEVVLGTLSTSGTARFGTTGSSIKVGRDLTLQAADGGTVAFVNSWQDLASGTSPAVAFTVGSAGNAGTVVFESFLPTSITAVNVRRGTLRLGPGGSFGDETIGFSTPVTLGETGAGGTLDLNGSVQPLASLSFAGVNSSVGDDLGGGGLALFNNGSAAAVSVTGTGHTLSAAVFLDDAATLTVASGGRLGISSVIANGTSGARGLTKTGLGILELAGANTFTGNTTVSAGTLVVNGSLANGPLEVAAGATLMGSGTIGGAATIFGIHSPGNSPGVATFATHLTYSGSTPEVIWELWDNTDTNSPTVAFDQIVVGGNLDFAAPTSLALSFGGLGNGTVDWDDPFWNSDQTWTLYDVAGTTTGFVTNFSLASSPASWLDSSGQAFSSSVRSEGSFSVAQQGSDVVIQYAVPEPATAVLALAGLGLAAAAAARRRRLRRRPWPSTPGSTRPIGLDGCGSPTECRC